MAYKLKGISIIDGSTIEFNSIEEAMDLVSQEYIDADYLNIIKVVWTIKRELISSYRRFLRN